MTEVRDVIRAQYENWVYPLPIPDLGDAINDGVFDYGDPALFRRKLWPRNVEPAALEILVAGCGSNQAAHYALTNPDSHVVGIDLSEASLDQQRVHKERHKLDNLELRQLPLESAGDLGQSFDLVVSTGVLMLLSDPGKGLRSLRDVLAPHGVMSLMLYGYYGRVGVYMLQEVLRLLGAEQDADGLELARHALDTMPEWHPAHRYLEIAPDLDYDSGLIDTFLIKFEGAHTVPQVLRFARDNGLKFQGWLDSLHYSVSAYLPDADDILRHRVEMLAPEEQWRLVELFWQVPATHRFLLCHPDRPETDYALDFSGDAWLDYVPSLRPPVQVIVSQELRSASIDDTPALAGVAISRKFHTIDLDRLGMAVIDLVDGERSIRQIHEEAAQTFTQAGWDANDEVEDGRRFFRQMAEWDHFQFEIR